MASESAEWGDRLADGSLEHKGPPKAGLEVKMRLERCVQAPDRERCL